MIFRIKASRRIFDYIMLGIPGWRVISVTSATAIALRYFYLYTNSSGIVHNMASSPKGEKGFNWKEASSIYDFTVKDIHGNNVSLEKYRGNVCLIVNVASQCGLTATNYKELVDLHDKYNERGFKILAFPCNQFGGQEPGTNEDIVCFAKSKNAIFDFFDKVDVNGRDAHPLWNYLKDKQGGTLGSFIKWNFTKFIIDKNGQPVERHGPNTPPSKFADNIEKYL